MKQPSFFLDDTTFVQFRDYIYELTGIHYTDGKRYLLDTRVRRRALDVGMADGPSYLDFLKNNPKREAEINQLIDQVSTHETSFFRHANQIKAFSHIASELIEQKRAAGKRKIKIWSAACSTGEEPYTLAMVLKELLGNESGWDITMIGTDISPGSIAQARQTRFPERNLRNVAEPYLSRYFVPDARDPLYQSLSNEIASMVEFQVLSLINSQQMSKFRDFDMVFCRNVLIYFDETAKKKVVDALWHSLCPGGHLALGPSDSLHGISEAFQRNEHSLYNFYQRPDVAADATTSTQRVERKELSKQAKRSDVAPLPSPARKPMATPPSRTESALSSGQSLRLKILIQRLDRGIRDLNQDLDTSLSKTIEAIGSVTDSLATLSDEDDLSPKVRSQLRVADRQLMRILLFLQVGDRAQQKSEALRAALQEMSDRLLGKEKEAPDLKVNISSFDENILPNDEQDQEASTDATMSQDDIDALFE